MDAGSVMDAPRISPDSGPSDSDNRGPTMTVDSYTYDELYSLAQEADVTEYSDLNKDEIHDLLRSEAPHILDPFAEVAEAEVGDEVSMNHLSSVLTVTEIRDYSGDDVVQELTDEVKTHEGQAEEITDHLVIIMETNRGGRHALVTDKAEENGPTPWTNNTEPHLRRWRAGDQEWMNNSTDPLFFRVIDDEDEDDE